MPASQSLITRMLVQTVIWLAITGALLFGSAGTLRWPQAWIFLAELGGLGLISGLAIAKRDPALLRERMAAPIQKDQKSWDKVLISVFFALWMSQYVVIGLDAVRFRWSDVPLWLQVVGGLAIAFGLLCLPRGHGDEHVRGAGGEDPERAQAPGDLDGPYAYVRHPMYAGAVPLIVGTPLLLGSWYGLIWAAALIALLGYRAVLEENTLKAELEGYDAYAARVRYRLVPGVW